MFIRSLSLFLVAAFLHAAPALTYSTYLRDSFTPKAIATDSAGNIYLAGSAVIDAGTGQTSALIVKLNPTATQYLYIRYLSGSVRDGANGIAVDGTGNAFVVGLTQSPDFPVTAGGALGTPPPAAPLGVQRSFLAKLDPNGAVVFSAFLGGSSSSSANAVAVTATGQIVVSGIGGANFPTTSGAYTIADSTNHPYLLELDPTGTKLVFSATGIGGSALAFDSSGNIYVAGTTTLQDYPTTPGAYQTKFPSVSNCSSPDCAFPIPGTNQYVSKIDPTGSKLIYSTAVTGTRNTGNGGLAVDQAGNVYVTGFAGNTYPYTVSVPNLPVLQSPDYLVLPFLTKLDANGQNLTYSIPIGGAGVQLDSNGKVYVGGYVGSAGIIGIPATIPALANVPATCLPSANPGGFSHVSAYASSVDAATGNLVGTRFIGGSTILPSGASLVGQTLWMTGGVSLPDFPFSPNALTIPNLGMAQRNGAYLGAVDFSPPPPPAGTPEIACVIDSATLAPTGPVARNQLITILGSNLGPAQPITAGDYSTTSLGGAAVNFGSLPAMLLYASSTQLNLAVPVIAYSDGAAPMKLSVNNQSAPIVQLPLTVSNPSLFSLALNSDGTLNSSTNGAITGSTVSVFVNGLSGLYAPTANIPPLIFTTEGLAVKNVVAVNPFVLRVDLQVPIILGLSNGSCRCVETMGFRLYYIDPNQVVGSISGQSFAGTVYVSLP